MFSREFRQSVEAAFAGIEADARDAKRLLNNREWGKLQVMLVNLTGRVIGLQIIIGAKLTYEASKTEKR